MAALVGVDSFPRTEHIPFESSQDLETPWKELFVPGREGPSNP